MILKTVNEEYHKKEDVKGQYLPTYQLKIDLAVVETAEGMLEDILEKTIGALLTNKGIVEATPSGLEYLGFYEILAEDIDLNKPKGAVNNEQ